MDIQHFVVMAQMAMQHGDYPTALHHLSMGLSQLPPQFSQYAAPLLAQRAECFWQLGNFQASVEDMTDAIRAGLPRDGLNSEKEASTWTSHGFFLLHREQSYYLAQQCATIALHFRADTPMVTAQPFLCRALSRYELGDISGTQRDIIEIKTRDSNLAKASAQTQKDIAINELQQRYYEKSLKSFNLALLLHPEDRSSANFKRSVKSHQAAAYFNLKKYRKALEVGEDSYKSNPLHKFTEEAERWKYRGNVLSREPNSVNLAIDYYTLALNFTPSDEKDLKGIILSNRSLMHKKRGSEKEALSDAQECVENTPNWAKAQYRLASCFSACKMYSEAVGPFSRSLYLLLNDSSSTEKDKEDTLNQLLSVALKHPGATVVYTLLKKRCRVNTLNHKPYDPMSFWKT